MRSSIFAGVTEKTHHFICIEVYTRGSLVSNEDFCSPEQSSCNRKLHMQINVSSFLLASSVSTYQLAFTL